MNTSCTSKVAVILFLGALWMPLLGMFFGMGQFRSIDENRELAQWPKPGIGVTGWFDFGSAFTRYFHDRFGFRGTLITAQALFKVKALGVSSSPDVSIGKQGWLFYTAENSMDNYRGTLPFAPGELGNWVQLFQRREDWLARRGIAMCVAIVPDKQTIYPEFLPSWVGKARGPTRLDAFLPAIRHASNVPALDLRAVLLDAKTRHLEVYHRTDTHWNAPGIYAAYVEILREIAKKYPDLRPVPFSDNVHGGAYTPGDLAKMLGLGSVWREIPQGAPQPPELRSEETPEGDLLIRQPGASNRRLAMFGDSFMFPLIPYLARHFGRTWVSRAAVLKPALLERERPDIVLFEMVERKLNSPAPRDPLD